MVSHDYCLCSVFCVKTVSIRYILANGIMALWKILFVILLGALVSWSKLLPHLSLKSYVATYVWCFEIWKVLIYGTYMVPIYIYIFIPNKHQHFFSKIHCRKFSIHLVQILKNVPPCPLHLGVIKILTETKFHWIPIIWRDKIYIW